MVADDGYRRGAPRIGADACTLAAIVTELRTVLGAKLVAYVSGATDTRTIREWAEEIGTPSGQAAERLRLVHEIVEELRRSESVRTISTWLQGMNPVLNDRSPARVIREEPVDDARAHVIAATHALVST